MARNTWDTWDFKHAAAAGKAEDDSSWKFILAFGALAILYAVTRPKAS